MTPAQLIAETEALLLSLESKSYPGTFITFEGIEGSGKSTQSELLFKRLVEEGHQVVKTVEPGGTAISEEIRELLLRTPGANTRSQETAAVQVSGWQGNDESSTHSDEKAGETRVWGGTAISAKTEALLYAASRAEHVRQVIRPALESGAIVICDRYIDSTLAYQGGGRQLGFEYILSLHTLATDDLFPDLTLLFDIDVSTALRRARRSGADRIEQEKLSFHRRVHQSFEQISNLYPERVRVLDAQGSKEEIAESVYHVVMAHLLGRGLSS